MHLVAEQHILVAIDGSPDALDAFHTALAQAHAFGAVLTVLHVAVPATPRNPMSVVEARRLVAEAEAEGHRLLQEVQALAGGRIPLRTELLSGNPAEAILRRAQELEAELIVVGSRGLNAVDRFLLGSTSTAVVHRAPCSVLVVRPQPNRRALMSPIEAVTPADQR